MEVTLFKKSARAKHVSYSCSDIYDVIEQMKSGKYAKTVAQFREVVASLKEDSEYHLYDQIYKVIPGGKYTNTRENEPKFVSYSGIVTLHVDNLHDECVRESIKDEAKLLPQTLAAFVGANGHSVVILTRATLPGMELPRTIEDARLFHVKAYRTAVMCYSPTLSRPITLEDAQLDASFMISDDPELLMNDEVAPFILRQPNAMEVKQLLDGRQPENQLANRGDKREYVSMHQVFNGCLMRARASINKERWLIPMAAITAIAQECAECGLPEEEATQHLIWHFRKVDELDVRSTVRAIYDEESPLPALTITMGKKQLASIKLREFFKRRYDLRRNTVTQVLEYRTKYSLDFRFHELTKYDRNTIKYEAAIEGIEAFDAEINGFIESNYTPTYNPIEDFIAKLEPWDGKDRLKGICDMVPTNNPNWERLFQRWFLSMVAHWMNVDRDHGNNTAPILIGEQGFRKSTFCRILLPPELRSFFTDSLDFRTKQEAERYLSRFLLINIDEFDQLSENQFSFVKHLFQKPNVSMRRMYSEAISQQPRYASFIGTSNHQEILRDPTGNRRYLCVEVTARIHTENPIDYNQLYAQAVTLIRRGERYWLNDEDESLLRETNKQFEVQSPLELVLLDTFTPSNEYDEGAKLLKLTDILAEISRHPVFNKKTMNSLSHLGRAIRKLKFEGKRKCDGLHYWVKAKKTTPTKLC